MRLIGSELTCRRGARQVLTDVSFAVAGGQLLTVTGPNGAGKSTLLRLIAGLLAPVSGSIRLDDGPSGTDLPRLAHYFGHQDAIKAGWTVAADVTSPASPRMVSGTAGSNTKVNVSRSIQPIGRAPAIVPGGCGISVPRMRNPIRRPPPARSSTGCGRPSTGGIV